MRRVRNLRLTKRVSGNPDMFLLGREKQSSNNLRIFSKGLARQRVINLCNRCSRSARNKPSGNTANNQIHQMKTTRIASLLAATLSIALAASVSAAPASKQGGPSASGAKSTGGATVEHKVMKHVGPVGKSYRCSH